MTRVVVCGAGALGAASAWALARRGYDVSVVERFAVGHDRGSSHGRARIFRVAYPEADYVELARRAQAGWRSLGDGLLTVTGGVDHGDEAMLATLEEQDVAFQRWSARDASGRWPGMRFDGDVLFQAEAGRIDAARAVEAMLSGVPVRTGVRVDDVAALETDLVVIAAGAWTPSLFAGAPALRVTLEQPMHFPSRGGLDWPSFIHHRAPGGSDIVYGLFEPGAGVKIGEHGGGLVVDPDSESRPVDAAAAERLREYVREWYPGADADGGVIAPCLYDSTPTLDPVIDRVGDVILAYGFSGHGFKFAPAVGELVADLAEGGRPWPRFAIER